MSTAPLPEILQLVLGLARKQVDQAALDALAFEQRVVDLSGDRHVDAVPLGERERRIHRVRAFRGPWQGRGS
jgi:hypothetical protein